MRYVFFVLFGILAAAHLFFCVPPVRHTLRKYTKPLLVPLLIGCYVTASAAPSLLVVLALAFGCAGDVLLLFPERPLFLKLGGAAFAAGHILYVVTFLSHLGGKPPFWLLAAAVAAYAAVIAVVLSILMPALPADMRVYSCIYTGLISLMSLSALLLAVTRAGVAPKFVFAGSLLFIVSDTLLSNVTFKKRFPWAYFSVILPYIAAQSCIALGLAGMGGV